ncbi:hypothetical protein [Methanorbis furvi]|uniref:Uncharacterized protein n=1 Tax=Methanorbis furvi TaxID=3028299 RepID=A0AAE4MCH7_9EURY|nr:hypothetical protein [Methanocorpusculaceae archaeon Ag1]
MSLKGTRKISIAKTTDPRIQRVMTVMRNQEPDVWGDIEITYNQAIIWMLDKLRNNRLLD